MFDQIFLFPQLKQSAIIGKKYAESGKSQNFVEFYPTAQSCSQDENFVDTSKYFVKNRN